MDFTGMMMQDHYRAIVDERARAIEGARWRRAWFAHTNVENDDCCATDTHANDAEVCAPAAVRANVTAGRA